MTEYIEIISQNRPQTGKYLYQMPSGGKSVLQPYTSLPDPIYLDFTALNGESEILYIIIICVCVCVCVHGEGGGGVLNVMVLTTVGFPVVQPTGS